MERGYYPPVAHFLHYYADGLANRAASLADMSTDKIRVGILFGGKSAEHEVSLQSALNVAAAVDRNRYDVCLIGIDKTGKWLLPDQAHWLINPQDAGRIALNTADATDVVMLPECGGRLLACQTCCSPAAVDVVFPVLHGPLGEDGTVQGLLRLANVPFVGSDVLASATCMDKDVAKRLLRDAGLPVADFVVVRDGNEVDFDAVRRLLGVPFFVKPANLGSSVGVSKVHDAASCRNAVELARRFDEKVLLEAFVAGRELECAVLGNRHPVASGVGEVRPQHAFYSYEAKYIDDKGADLQIPAVIGEDIAEQVRELSVKAFKVLECSGLARVDFFLTDGDTLVINEINTLPGFTKISMYPQLWAERGLDYPDLIDRLLQLAIERHSRTRRLHSTFGKL
jgi:D-alanine-D-alanine ligase